MNTEPFGPPAPDDRLRRERVWTILAATGTRSGSQDSITTCETSPQGRTDPWPRRSR
jgi:hypothetical protein